MKKFEFNTVGLNKGKSITSDVAIFVSALPVSFHNMFIYIVQYLSKYTYISTRASISEVAIKLINTCLLKRI